MAQNGQLEGHQVVRMDPVLGCLADKRALIPASARVSLDGVATSANEIIKFGKFDNERIPVVLVKGSLFEVLLDKGRFQRGVRLFLWLCQRKTRATLNDPHVMFLKVYTWM